MKKATRAMAALAIVGAIGMGFAALMATPAKAVDNPCDPVFSLIRACKAQHGHWDSSCCCCKLH